jgi:hypothetical protein
VEFEPTIPLSERAKTFRALDSAATVIGGWENHLMQIQERTQSIKVFPYFLTAVYMFVVVLFSVIQKLCS